MNVDTIITLALTIFGSGVGIGAIRSRLTTLEHRLNKLEAKIDQIHEHIQNSHNSHPRAVDFGGDHRR